MRIVARAGYSVTKSDKGQFATVCRGHIISETVVDGVVVGKMNIPFKIQTTFRDGAYGPLWASVNGWARYNGGKSSLSPWAEDETVDALKGMLPCDAIFTMTDDAGEKFELTLNVEAGTAVEISRRMVSVVNEETQGRLLKLADKLGAAAQAADEKAAQRAQQKKDQGLDQFRNGFQK